MLRPRKKDNELKPNGQIPENSKYYSNFFKDFFDGCSQKIFAKNLITYF